MSETSILLVIVNYNQVKEIDSFLSSVINFWPQKDTLIVDDGSTDGSAELLTNYSFRYILHKENQGVGAAIRTGIYFAKKEGYDAVLIMSSNGKMLPSDIPVLTNQIKTNGADYTTGSRFIPGGSSPGLSLFRRMSIPLFSYFSSLLIGKFFSDITCGFRCYRIDFLFQGDCDISQVWLSKYELEYYIHYWAFHKKLRIIEVPVTIRYDHLEKNRKSKIQPIIGWWSMIRPLLFLRFGLKK